MIVCRSDLSRRKVSRPSVRSQRCQCSRHLGLVSPQSRYCQYLHNNTLRVTASESRSADQWVAPVVKHPPPPPGSHWSRRLVPAAGAVRECVAGADNAGCVQQLWAAVPGPGWAGCLGQASVLPLRSSVLAAVQ